MKKELKRQIKQDEFATGLGRTLEWLRAHQQAARATTIVVVLVAALAAGLGYLRQRRNAEARQALAAALEIFHAPVRGSAPPGEPQGAISHATPEEKFRKAAAAFDGVERRFGSQAVSLTASYYAALCRIELGDLAEAEKALTQLAAQRQPERLEPALARLALAGLHRRSGEVDRAADLYRQAAEDSSLPLPRDHVLMSLASLLEEAGRLADARSTYQRLVNEFPASVYAADARSRARYLQTAAQG